MERHGRTLTVCWLVEEGKTADIVCDCGGLGSVGRWWRVAEFYCSQTVLDGDATMLW